MNWIIFSHFRTQFSGRSGFVWLKILLPLITCVACYNVDIEHPLIFHGKPGSYFGATAEIVVDSKKWVLVGATKDNFTDKPEIPFPGNVYACPVDFHSKSICTVLPNLRTAELHANKSQGVFEEKEQLLGASILVPEDSTKAIKICAPNWKNLRFFNPSDGVEDYYQVTGNCFLLKNRSDLMNNPESSRFRISPDLLDFYKAPLIGFSLSDIKTPVFETLYGAPNVGRSSTGGIVGKNDGTLTSVSSLKLEVERSEVIKNTYLTGSLFGYSIAIGNLGVNPYHFVVGAPGFSNRNGNIGAFSVFILGAPPRQVKQIEGKQVGGGFGQTLCIADVNGDNNDEILVAAPNWFSMDDQGNQVLNDIGAVYIYYGTGKASIIDDTPQELHGSFSPFSRFGTAIANIGDINRDGYNDIAIGAPFENKEGALYIFNGGKSRVHDLYSQKITGSNIKQGLQGFGWYISRTAKDLDDNMYNDFAVGAYRSDTALVLRSRNIIDVNCEITTNPDRIPLNASGAFCSYGRDFNPCFSVSLRLNFTGDGIKDTEIDFTITIDANETRKRAEITNTKNQLWTKTVSRFLVFPNKLHSYNLELRVPVIDRRFFQVMERPIVIRVDYKISNSSETGKVRAILRRDVTPTFYGKVRFDTGCKSEDGLCQSNLNLRVTFDKKRLLIGNDTILQMKIVLKNSGEPSFKTSLAINHPAQVRFNTLKISQSSVKMSCEEVKNNSIECEIENPFYQRMKGELDVFFEVSKYLLELTSGYVSTKNLVFNVTSQTNNDVHPEDNTVVRNVAVAAFTRTTLQVSASDEQITTANSSIQFSNTYRLFNDGPCVIEKVDLQFFIPVRTQDKIFIKEGDVKVQNSDEKDHCEMSYYPRSTLKTSTQNPISGSSTLQYNTSGIRITSTDPDFQPIRGMLESSQYIFCDNGGTYMCAVVDCTLKMVRPVDSDSRTFGFPFDILLKDLPELEKGKSFYTFVTRGRVIPNKRSSVPLVLSKNVSEEIYVAIILPNSFSHGVEELDLAIIILGSVGGLLLIILLGIILWKCGFFKREKRKQVEDFKRKSRKNRMESVRSARSGAGSSRSKATEDQETLNKKFDEMDDTYFTS